MSASELPVLYVDNDLDADDFVVPLLDAAASGEFRVERHTHHFPGNAKDYEWIPEVAARGWYAVSHDVRIYRNAVQRSFTLDHGLGLFVVRGDRKTHMEMGQNVARAIPAILRRIQKQKRPFVCSVSFPDLAGRPPKVNLRYPKPGS